MSTLVAEGAVDDAFFRLYRHRSIRLPPKFDSSSITIKKKEIFYGKC